MKRAGMDWPLLKAVSRSFYLTLRVLPGSVRESIALAYLLARLTDTIADGAESPAEEELLRREQEIRGWLEYSPDRAEIEKVWGTIQEGQRFDGERFDAINTRVSPNELDGYTYLVAGSVGEFWTEICAKHVPGFAARPVGEMRELGIRFGKGLQLVNILRDRAADLKKGRVYLPEERVPEALGEARRHLEGASDYVKALRKRRLRLACALPYLLALETLDLVERDPAAPRVKVSRRRVKLIFLKALFF